MVTYFLLCDRSSLVSLCVHDCKSLCATVTICATPVNIQTDTRTDSIWPARLGRRNSTYWFFIHRLPTGYCWWYYFRHRPAAGQELRCKHTSDTSVEARCWFDCPVLTEFFNRSLSSAIVPKVFKSALITPLLKKPDLDSVDPRSYRPISNLPMVSKILKRFPAALPDLLPRLQSAYRTHHSTEIQATRVHMP